MVGSVEASSNFPTLSFECLGICDLVNHFLISRYKISRMVTNRNEDLEGNI